MGAEAGRRLLPPVLSRVASIDFPEITLKCKPRPKDYWLNPAGGAAGADSSGSEEAAGSEFELVPLRCTMELQGCGGFLCYASQRPAAVLVDGQEVEFTYDSGKVRTRGRGAQCIWHCWRGRRRLARAQRPWPPVARQHAPSLLTTPCLVLASPAGLALIRGAGGGLHAQAVPSPLLIQLGRAMGCGGCSEGVP